MDRALKYKMRLVRQCEERWDKVYSVLAKVAAFSVWTAAVVKIMEVLYG